MDKRRTMTTEEEARWEEASYAAWRLSHSWTIIFRTRNAFLFYTIIYLYIWRCTRYLLRNMPAPFDEAQNQEPDHPVSWNGEKRF